jgi:hypothetical protein
LEDKAPKLTATLALFPVPASHKEDLGGADLACEHIAKHKGGPQQVTVVRPQGSPVMALCGACAAHVPQGMQLFDGRAAKAGQ